MKIGDGGYRGIGENCAAPLCYQFLRSETGERKMVYPARVRKERMRVEGENVGYERPEDRDALGVVVSGEWKSMLG